MGTLYIYIHSKYVQKTRKHNAGMRVLSPSRRCRNVGLFLDSTRYIFIIYVYYTCIYAICIIYIYIINKYRKQEHITRECEYYRPAAEVGMSECSWTQPFY